MRLRWVFTVQTVVILPKNTFAFMFNRPRSTYTGRAGGSARGKGFNNTFFTRSSVCSMWPDGNDMGRGIDGPEFARFLFFLSFSFGLVFFLVITVFFCFFILLTKIFRFINFLLYCLILQFSRSPSWGPAIYVFLVIGIPRGSLCGAQRFITFLCPTNLKKKLTKEKERGNREIEEKEK